MATKTFGRGKLGSGSRFARCVEQMSERPDVYDPEGLCAYIGRRAYGGRAMAEMAAAGRRNPVSLNRVNARLSDAVRGRYFDTLGDGIRTLEQAIAPHRLDFNDVYLEAVDREQSSRLYRIPFAGESADLVLSYYRMPSGSYEITAYATKTGKRNPAVDPDSPEYRRTLERIYGKPAPRPSVHLRSPKDALQYEWDRRQGEKVGQYNPFPRLREIVRIGTGGEKQVLEILPGYISDTDAYHRAREIANRVGEMVMLTGWGTPIRVSPRMGRLNPLAPDDKYRKDKPVRINERMEEVSKEEPRLVEVTACSGNEKTGPVMATSLSQLSCPESCPFFTPWSGRTKGGLGKNGCYAEVGRQGLNITRYLNEAGLKVNASPELIAKAEAKGIEIVLNRILGGHKKPMRLHVVGDAKTNAAARILAEVCRDWPDVWTYTHAWRDVDRSSWGSISVLASCETPEEIREAQAKGYATAVVLPYALPEKVKPFEWEGGLKIQPCWEQTGHKADCMHCKLCWRDKALLRQGVSIGFQPHGATKGKAKDNALVKLEQSKRRKGRS